MSRYEVQGRRVERVDDQRAVRKGVRLVTESTMSAAVEAAEKLVDDGYTAWIFAIDFSPPAHTKSYKLIRMLSP